MGIPVELELADLLTRLLRLVRRLATAGDLSLPAASVLAVLDRDGPQRLTDLASHERISQPAMTQLVTRLERDGFARRTADSGDRRVVVVDVTDAGRQVLHDRRDERADALRELLSRLQRADRDAIRAALPALGRLLEAAPTAPATPRRRTVDQREAS